MPRSSCWASYHTAASIISDSASGWKRTGFMPVRRTLWRTHRQRYEAQPSLRPLHDNASGLPPATLETALIPVSRQDSQSVFPPRMPGFGAIDPTLRTQFCLPSYSWRNITISISDRQSLDSSRVELCCAHMLCAEFARQSERPLFIKYPGRIHAFICFLKPPHQTGHRVFPGTAFRRPSPLAYQHPLSMKHPITRTGITPAWRASRHEVSCYSSYRRCTSALGILEVGPMCTRSVSEYDRVGAQQPCGSCASRATPD